MNEFSIGGAWSRGYRFFAGRWLVHAVFLIVGVLLPVGFDYAIMGDQAGMRITPTPMGSRIFDEPAVLMVLLLGYWAQVGSYFASWRYGLDEKRSLPGAPLFGLPAGLVAVAAMFVGYVLAAYLWMPLLTPDLVFLAILAFLLPLILASAPFLVVGLVFVAAALILFLVFALVYGAANGQVNLAATLVGGSGAITVLLLILSASTFWLCARLSCVAPVMAQRKSLNLFAAIAESWRLTWEEQWAITRYLALIGGVLALMLVLVSLAVGFSAQSMLPGGASAFDSDAVKIAGLVIGVPFAFLAVGVPAGIYRQLVGEETPAEIFD